MRKLEMELSAPQVMHEFHQTAQLQRPLYGDWLPHTLLPGQTSRAFVAVGPAGAGFVPAKWGRDRLTESPYLQRQDPSIVKRGLVFVSGYIDADPHGETHERFYYWYRVSATSRPWYTLGCSWEKVEETGELQFAVLNTNFRGRDLEGIPISEPLIVPPSRWNEWLSPTTKSDFAYVTGPGTLRFTQI
jgi:hypothetical protein